MTFVSALFSRTHFNANYFAVLNESFKVISLFSYQSPLFRCRLATFISYHSFLRLSTGFFIFLFLSHRTIARWTFIIAPNFMPVNSFFHFFYLYRQGYPHCRIYCSSRTVSTALLLVRYGESKFLSFHRFLYLLAYNFIVGFGCL